MSIVSPDGSRVTLDGPSTLPIVIPHLLGFHPTDSLVVIGLDATTSTVRITCRVDLPNDNGQSDWAPLIHALTRSKCVGALVVVYPAADTSLRELPSVAVVRSVVADLNQAGFVVRDAVAISGLRYRSYWCADDGCCPEDGSEPSSEHVLELTAALVLEGSAPRASRQELMAALDRRGPEDPLVREVRARRGGIEMRLPSGHDARARAVVDLLRDHQPMSHVSLVRLIGFTVGVCSDVVSRDLLLFHLTRDPDAHSLNRARIVLGEVVRCFDGHERASAAACLAVCSWVLGDGASARIAVEVAERSESDCRLATLVGIALDHAEPPSVWTSMMRSMSVGQLTGAAARQAEF
jgi:hypothetical protein